MIANPVRAQHFSSTLCTAARVMVAAVVLCVAGADGASAYVGKSFMELPGISGDWQGKDYKNWIGVDGNYWKTTPFGAFARRRKDWAFYSGPTAPRSGESQMVISIDKHSRVVPKLMGLCANKTPVPELTYAESSQRARYGLELGDRPADIPEYFEYKLKDVLISDCPVVSGAPEQAFVVAFKDIEWLNYHKEGDGEPLALEPAVLPPTEPHGKTKTFVVNWIALANDSETDQCTTMSEKPTEADYYALMSKDDADKERIRLAPKGGPTFPDGQICFRGPHQLNACLLPGIVNDPVQPTPKVAVARGLNLDGNDGTGAPQAGTCKHKNYVSDDGRKGIDNQVFTVEGCMRGYLGHKGQQYQYFNEQMHNGLLSIMLRIDGIDDEQNDDSVDVTLFYSLDPMEKDAAGNKILPDFTFRTTDKPEYTHYFLRLHGRITNGVLTTDTVHDLHLHIPYNRAATLYQAAMRLQLMPDGSIKGVLGGYQDWREIVNDNAHSLQESLFGSQVSAMYNALKRAADGFKDPVTGKCNGISLAYDIEGVPALVPPNAFKTTDARTQTQAP